MYAVSKTGIFNGFVLENGAAGTPSEFSAYLRYFHHIGIEPHLGPINKIFVVFGEVTLKSFGVATVGMPLGRGIFLYFETGIVLQDFPLFSASIIIVSVAAARMNIIIPSRITHLVLLSSSSSREDTYM